jgi:fumarylacetoacetate (FAA) hydrolase
LQDLYDALNAGRARHPFPFDAAQCMAPLPRAYQRLAYEQTQFPVPNKEACQLSVSSQTSATLLGARSLIPATAFWACLGAGLAVITGDAPPCATPEQGQDAIRLITLIHALDLIGQAESGQPCCLTDTAVLGPTAITPDELGAAWRDSRVHLNLSLTVNGRLIRTIHAGEMRWSFGEIIAKATENLLFPLAAGTIVGNGSPVGPPGLEYRRGGVQEEGRDDLLRVGDTVRIEMLGPDGQSVFGAIEQTVE